MLKPEIPYEKLIEVLKKFESLGILKDLLLVGSWPIYFYKLHFGKDLTISPLRTRDADFLFHRPPRIQNPIDLGAELEKLGFIIDIRGKGFQQFQHLDLFIDFLIPEKGSPKDMPYPIKELSISVTPLTHMDMLWERPLEILVGDLTIQVPHPVDFAIHKMIISDKRRDRIKAKKDFAQAMEMIHFIESKPELTKVFETKLKHSPKTNILIQKLRAAK